MPTAVLAQNYVIGPAEIYHRATGVNTPWTNMGATLDDAAMRIVAEWFVPDNITGVKGPIKGLDILRRLNAEFEFTLPDFVGGNLDKIIPGSRVTAESHADAGGTPFSSTIAVANVAAGATSIEVAAVTNLAVGDYIRIGSGAGVLVEYRQVTAIAANVISFRDRLLVAHAIGEDAVETDGDYRTLYRSSLYDRMPDTAYDEWAMVMANGNGYHELRIPIGISNTESAEVTIGDNTLSGVRVMVSARRDGSDLTISPFDLWINESVGP